MSSIGTNDIPWLIDRLYEAARLGSSMKTARRCWLVAEYCGHDIYTGWHLYLRDHPGYQKRNKDGDWGWLRRLDGDKKVQEFFTSIGITLKGDGTRDADGLMEFAQRFPLPGRKVWGKRRGGVRVTEARCGELALI